MISIEQVISTRKHHSITQRDFADLIGIPIGTWSNVEAGRQPFYGERQAKALQVFKELDITPLPIGNTPQTTSPTLAVIEGVSPDEPVVFNEQGGKQSRVLYRMDLVDPKAILATAKVLKEGADKYGAENWRLIDIDDHLNHLLIHIYAYLAGDRSDDHLSHSVCRALFALAVQLQTEEDVEKVKRTKRQGE